MIFGFIISFAVTFLILPIIIRFASKRNIGSYRPEHSIHDSYVPTLGGVGMFVGFFAGLSSGLLGIGGGSLMVPIMTLGMGIPIHITVATSMLIMIFTSTSGVIQHFSLGNIRFEYVLLLVLGTIFGAQIGAYTSKRISSRNLRRIFGIILILISIRMILKYI